MELESIRPLAAAMMGTVVSSELTPAALENICSMPLEDVVDFLADGESAHYSPEFIRLMVDVICDAGQAAGDPYTVEIVRCANTAGYVETEAFITSLEDVPRTYVVTFTLLDAAGGPITFENGYAFNVPPGSKQAVEAIFFEDVRFDSCEATVAVR